MQMCGSPMCSRLVKENHAHVTYGAYVFCDLHCMNVFLTAMQRLVTAANPFGERKKARKWHECDG